MKEYDERDLAIIQRSFKLKDVSIAVHISKLVPYLGCDASPGCREIAIEGRPTCLIQH